MQHDPESLQDMAIAARKVIRFVQGVTFQQFIANDEKQAAVFGELIILGEAANRVSIAGQRQHPEIPWRQIIATRNRIVHGYDAVDWQIIWDIAAVELPGLLQQLRDYLPIADSR